MRELLTILLRKSGHQVAAASSGDEALGLVAKAPPDLVITDLKMPGISGLELISRLKTLDPDRPIIVITAFSTWDSTVEAMRRGAYDYVKKPFDNEEIREAVERALRRRRILAEEVRAGRFRGDLFFRLNVIPITLPPLRAREGDIPLLAGYFVRKYAAAMGREITAIAPAAQAKLERYRWPCNVRELENVIQQAMVFCEGKVLRAEDLPAPLRQASPEMPVLGDDRSLTEILEELERQLVIAAYQKANGVKAETARLLGIKPSALYYKLEKYGIVAPGEGAD